MSSIDVTHVLYHGNCPDGFGAAYAAWMVLGDKAEYLPVRHGEEPPALGPQDRVAVVDFSYPRSVLLELRQRVAHLVVLDHHTSAQEDLDSLDFAHFDLTKSGARMAWDYWHPQDELPMLLAYVEDRDLWRNALPHSREVAVALHSYPMDFRAWAALDVETLRQEGSAILRYQDQQVARALTRTRWVHLGEHLVPVVNSCLFQSEIGDELCRLFPEASFAGVYYTKPDGTQAWSLRSIGAFSVAEVARGYGGGGHRNSAGFALNEAPHRAL